MSISNPLSGLKNYLNNWDGILTRITDNYYGAMDIGSLCVSEEEFVKPSIKKSIRSTLDTVKTEYDRLLSDQDRMTFIVSVFEKLEHLLNDFKKETGFNKYIPFANEELRNLQWNLHYHFDNELIAIKSAEMSKDHGKIKMNLSKTEILHLFIMLRDMDYIDKNISNYALGSFLESSFLYFNSRKKDYMPLKKVAVEFGEIHSQASFSENILKKVKEIISNGQINLKE